MKQTHAILLVLALSVMGGAWVYLQQQDLLVPSGEEQQQADSSAQASLPAAPTEPAAPEQLTLRQNFENLLNGFLGQIASKANDYKKERRVLAEIVRPENLKTDEYIDQNFALMKQTVPALHLKIDDLMLVFEDTEKKVRDLLVDQTPDVQEPILAEWKEMKEQQANLYIEFFNIEEKVLEAYEEMMTVYHDKKGSYSFDEATGKIVFKNPEDEAPITAIRERLMGYVQDEAKLLKDESQPEPAPEPSLVPEQTQPAPEQAPQ